MNSNTKHVEEETKLESVEEETKSKSVEEETKSKSVEEETKSKSVEEETKSKSVEKETKLESIEEETKSESVEEETKLESVEEETKLESVEKETKLESIEEETKSESVEEETKLESVEEETKLESVEEETILMQFPDKYKEVEQLIQLLLCPNNKFNEFLFKSKITLNSKQRTQISNILEYLNKEIEGKKHLSNIIDEMIKFLSDKKSKFSSSSVYEIPELVNVIHESLFNVKIINIITVDLGILVKIILLVLIETKIVKFYERNYDLIIKVIDTSILLLNKSTEIKLPTTNKCFCF